MLRRWAESKYQIPWTHESLQQLSVLDLLIAFWEDHYQRNPMESRRGKDGKVVYGNTGDALIDKWEEELGRGLTPDLLEGLSPEQRKREKEALEKLKQQSRRAKSEGVKDGFSENYQLERTGLPFLGRG